MVDIMRRLKEIAKTPVIMMSSLGANIGPEEMKQYGIAATISKPLRTIRLYEAIIDVFSGVSGWVIKRWKSSKNRINLKTNRSASYWRKTILSIN